uniref:(northern house mosquito) hypothetical protein n=1 Tax=Culex pipiens TaxID=7175 RepID=A0A8D8A6V9_CULPI
MQSFRVKFYLHDFYVFLHVISFALFYAKFSYRFQKHSFTQHIKMNGKKGVTVLRDSFDTNKKRFFWLAKTLHKTFVNKKIDTQSHITKTEKRKQNLDGTKFSLNTVFREISRRDERKSGTKQQHN